MNTSMPWLVSSFRGLATAVGIFLSLEGAYAAKSVDDFTGFFENASGVPLIELIDSTQSTLDIEIYEMNDPKVVASLHRAVKRGVVVNVVKEPNPVGATCKVFDSDDSGDEEMDDDQQAAPVHAGVSCEEQRELMREIQKKGKYVPFAKAELCGGGGTKSCLEHGKLIVSDAKVAMVSTGNFNPTNLCNLETPLKNCNRDYTYGTKDPKIVRAFRSVVHADIRGESYELGDITSTVPDKITVGPDSLTPLVNFIRSAKKTLQIQNQYLREPAINRALTERAQKGVQVQIMVASACSFGEPSESEVRRTRAIFKSFDSAGIESRMFTKNIKINGQDGYLHAKAIVVDGQRAWVGSVNGSTQATTLNREFGIFVDAPADVRKLSKAMSRDFVDSNAETWQESLNCQEHKITAASESEKSGL